jgi:hypothetical protein
MGHGVTRVFGDENAELTFPHGGKLVSLYFRIWDFSNSKLICIVAAADAATVRRSKSATSSQVRGTRVRSAMRHSQAMLVHRRQYF